MTIMTSAYISLTGLLTFSKALDAVSDNVANLNTPGFKGSELFFKDLTSSRDAFLDLRSHLGEGIPGSGASVEGGGRRFLQGEIRETGTVTHLAIDGSGFFVLKSSEGLFFTRAGQFEFDEQGRLVDPTTGRVVQALLGNNQLADVVVNRFQTSPPQSTSKMTFAGNLSVGSPTHQIGQVSVFDADGKEHVLTIEFTNNTAVTSGSWLVRVTNAEGAELLAGEIRFSGSGSPQVGFNTLQLELQTESGQITTIELDFGSPGTFEGATSFSAGPTSTAQVGSVDGFGIGRLIDLSFDEKGLLTLRFSNGQTGEGPRVALASFSDPQQLISESGTVFTTRLGLRVEYGTAGDRGLGRLAPRSLELSNIELSREFADIIILQRGFQASSQVLNVSSQLIEDLYNNLSGRR